MSLTDIGVEVSMDSKENDTLSVDKCVFCNTSLDGESNILNCLHIICKKCVKKKGGISGVKCKCLITTEGQLIDYPIISNDVLNRKICNTNTCNKEVTRICIYCKIYYCKPCSKIHLNIHEDHKSNYIITYPMRKPFQLCLSCKEKCVEVFCTKCSINICSLCHLNGHIKHKYNIIENTVQEMQTTFSHKKNELEESIKFMDSCSEKIDKQLDDLKNKGKTIKEEIDKQIKLLHQKINDRENELKNSVDISVSNTISKINEKQKNIVDLKKKNSYYVDLTQSILNHNDLYSLLNVSKIVEDHLNANKVDPFEFRNVSNLEVNLKFDYTETINKCFSAIKEVGNIISLPMNSLPEDNDTELVKNQDDYQASAIQASSSESNESSDSDLDFVNKYESIVVCSVCNQWAYKSLVLVDLIKCKKCNKLYHNKCHIPMLPNESTNNGNFPLNWTCTLCEDISEFFEISNLKFAAGDYTFGEVGHRVLERILMEIYCQNDDSDEFRDCPNIELYPRYYKKITHPISLNIIRRRVESHDSYISWIDFIKDLKRMFSNAMLYYCATSPDYVSAVNLNNYLNTFLNRYLPNLDYESFLDED